MADLGCDAVFVEESATLRPRLERCARVLYPGIDGDFDRAERAVDRSLAKTYALGPDADRTIAAFRALLNPTLDRTRRRGSTVERIELMDVAPDHPGGLADDLGALARTSQIVVVLTLVGAVSPDELSRIVGVPAARISERLADAVNQVARRDPARRDPRELTRQLDRLAGPSDPVATARAGVGDLARGRRLEQRARRRRGAVATAAVVVVVLLVAGVALHGGGQGEIANVPAATPTPTPSHDLDPWQPYGCDTSEPACRAQTLMRWRARISGVLVESLDNDRRYFSAMNWQVRPTPESESFWRGDGGALAVGLSRSTDGGTEVYLQVATDMKYADRCGQRIKKRCTVIETMDGNLYAIAGTSTTTGGVEVQYIPDEDRVITAVARNTSAGKKLDISSGDLIDLVRDNRIRLPKR